MGVESSRESADKDGQTPDAVQPTRESPTFSPVTPTGDEASTLSPIPSSRPGAETTLSSEPATQIPRVPLGQRIAGRYEVRSILGEGGQGIVYRAWDHEMRREVAIKRTLRTDEATVERFRHEVHATASLDHQNIRKAFNLESDDLGLVLVLEFVEGESLSEQVRSSGALTGEALHNLAQGLARALVHAHRRQVLHRDVKPGNILITPDDTAKLCDFGIARHGNDSELTLPGVGFGTLAYASPEQCRGERVDERTDVYAFGKTLYFALTAEAPRVVYEQRIPTAWRSLILQCLEEHPGDRPADAKQLLAAVDALASAPRPGAAAAGATYADTSPGAAQGAAQGADARPAAVRCLGCNAGNTAEARYCRGCGDALFADCPNPACLQEERIDVAHCGHCGQNIARGKQAWARLREAEEQFAQGRFGQALAGAQAALKVYSRLPEGLDLAGRADESLRRVDRLREQARRAERDNDARQALASWKQVLKLTPRDDEARQNASRLAGKLRRSQFERTLRALQRAADGDDLAEARRLHGKLNKLKLSGMAAERARARTLLDELEARHRRQLHGELGEILDDTRGVARADQLIDELRETGETTKLLEQLERRLRWTQQRSWLEMQLGEGDLEAAGQCLEPLMQAGLDAERSRADIGAEVCRGGLTLLAGGLEGWAEIALECLVELGAEVEAEQLQAALSAAQRGQRRRRWLVRAVLSLIVVVTVTAAAAFVAVESSRSRVRAALTALERGDTSSAAERLAEVSLGDPRLQAALDFAWMCLGAPDDTATLVSRLDGLRGPLDAIRPSDQGTLGTAELAALGGELDALGETLATMGVIVGGLERTVDVFRQTTAQRSPFFDSIIDAPFSEEQWPIALNIVERDLHPQLAPRDGAPHAATLNLLRRVLFTGATRLRTALDPAPADDIESKRSEQALDDAARLSSLIAEPLLSRVLDAADDTHNGDDFLRPLRAVLDRPWGDLRELRSDYTLVRWVAPTPGLGRPRHLRWGRSPITFSWVESSAQSVPTPAGFYLSDAPLGPSGERAPDWRAPNEPQRRLAAAGDNDRMDELQRHVVIPWTAPAPLAAPHFAVGPWNGVIRGDTTGPVFLSGTLSRGFDGAPAQLPSAATPLLTVLRHDGRDAGRDSEPLLHGPDGSWRSTDLTSLPDGRYELSLALATAGRPARPLADPLSLLIDRAAPSIELLSRLPASSGRTSAPISLRVSDAAPGQVGFVELVDDQGTVLDRLESPSGTVTLDWPLTGDEGERRAWLRAEDDAGNRGEPVALSVRVDRSALEVNSVVLNGSFHWKTEQYQAWVGSGELSVVLTTNKSLGPDSRIIARRAGQQFDVPIATRDARSITAALGPVLLSADAWTTLTFELPDDSTGETLSRELELRLDDTGPVFADESETFYSDNDSWHYPTSAISDAGSGVAALWIIPTDKKTRIDGKVHGRQLQTPTWTASLGDPSRGRTSNIIRTAELFAEDWLGHSASLPITVNFRTGLLSIEQVSLSLTEALTADDVITLKETAPGGGWSLLAGVAKDAVFEHVTISLSGQAERADVLGKTLFPWEPGNFWDKRLGVPLQKVGYEHFGFEDGRLTLQLSVWNKAGRMTETPLTIDLARRLREFRDTRPIASVALLDDGHVRVVPRGTPGRDWGPLLQSTARGSAELENESLSLSGWGEDEIRHAELSPDGSRVAIVGKTNEMNLRRVGGGESDHEHEGAEELVHAAFSPSGDRVVTASAKGTLVLHDTGNDENARLLIRASTSPWIFGLCCTDQGRTLSALVPDDRLQVGLAVWSEPSARPRMMQSLANPVAHALSADGSTVAVIGQLATSSGTQDAAPPESLQLFDVRPSVEAHGPALAQFTFAGAAPESVAFAECGRHLAVGTRSGTLLLFEIAGQELRLMGTLPAPGGGDSAGENPVTCLRFSRDESRLAAGTAHGYVTVWDLPLEAWTH